MCSAGDRPAGVRIGSPVAGRAGRRVTQGPEAPQQPHPRDERKFSGRNESERVVAPKVSSPGGRARNREGEGHMARRKPIDATGRSGGVVSDGTAARTHRATGEALLVPLRNRRKLIFEADFQPGSFGYRPGRTAHEAVQRVAEAIVKRKTRVIDIDLRAYFDNVRHDLLLAKVARRVNDAEVLCLLKMMLKASGKKGVPQGGVISPLLSNLYLDEVD